MNRPSIPFDSPALSASFLGRGDVKSKGPRQGQSKKSSSWGEKETETLRQLVKQRVGKSGNVPGPNQACDEATVRGFGEEGAGDKICRDAATVFLDGVEGLKLEKRKEENGLLDRRAVREGAGLGGWGPASISVQVPSAKGQVRALQPHTTAPPRSLSRGNRQSQVSRQVSISPGSTSPVTPPDTRGAEVSKRPWEPLSPPGNAVAVLDIQEGQRSPKNPRPSPEHSPHVSPGRIRLGVCSSGTTSPTTHGFTLDPGMVDASRFLDYNPRRIGEGQFSPPPVVFQRSASNPEWTAMHHAPMASLPLLKPQISLPSLSSLSALASPPPPASTQLLNFPLQDPLPVDPSLPFGGKLESEDSLLAPPPSPSTSRRPSPTSSPPLPSVTHTSHTQDAYALHSADIFGQLQSLQGGVSSRSADETLERPGVPNRATAATDGSSFWLEHMSTPLERLGPGAGAEDLTAVVRESAFRRSTFLDKALRRSAEWDLGELDLGPAVLCDHPVERYASCPEDYLSESLQRGSLPRLEPVSSGGKLSTATSYPGMGPARHVAEKSPGQPGRGGVKGGTHSSRKVKPKKRSLFSYLKAGFPEMKARGKDQSGAEGEPGGQDQAAPLVPPPAAQPSEKPPADASGDVAAMRSDVIPTIDVIQQALLLSSPGVHMSPSPAESVVPGPGVNISSTPGADVPASTDVSSSGLDVHMSSSLEDGHRALERAVMGLASQSTSYLPAWNVDLPDLSALPNWSTAAPDSEPSDPVTSNYGFDFQRPTSGPETQQPSHQSDHSAEWDQFPLDQDRQQLEPSHLAPSVAGDGFSLPDLDLGLLALGSHGQDLLPSVENGGDAANSLDFPQMPADFQLPQIADKASGSSSSLTIEVPKRGLYRNQGPDVDSPGWLPSPGFLLSPSHFFK